MTSFERARTDEQRAQRVQHILAIAEQMLTEMPVAQVTLNELSRRVGLAKSNVLRYFPSREAVLLHLLDQHMQAFLDGVATDLPADRHPADIADVVARQAAGRPTFCDLLANSTSVLERNVSTEVAARAKRASLTAGHRLARAAGFAGMGDPAGLLFVAATTLSITGMWTTCQPTEAMQEVYRLDPELAAVRPDFETSVRELVLTGLLGIQARFGQPSTAA